MSVDLTGVRILVVEDSPQGGQSTKIVLELLGAVVAGPAVSVAEADRLLFEMVPDVALVDFNLQGGELAVGLIDRLSEQGIPVVGTTGDADPPVTAKIVAAVLRKPVDAERLLAMLSSLAARRGGLG